MWIGSWRRTVPQATAGAQSVAGRAPGALAQRRVFTPADVPLFGDFTLYVSANVFNNVSTSQTTATLTPGFRTHLGGGWYALGGIDVPVTGPRPYQESATFWLMKTF